MMLSGLDFITALYSRYCLHYQRRACFGFGWASRKLQRIKQPAKMVAHYCYVVGAIGNFYGVYVVYTGLLEKIKKVQAALYGKSDT